MNLFGETIPERVNTAASGAQPDWLTQDNLSPDIGKALSPEERSAFLHNGLPADSPEGRSFASSDEGRWRDVAMLAHNAQATYAANPTPENLDAMIEATDRYVSETMFNGARVQAIRDRAVRDGMPVPTDLWSNKFDPNRTYVEMRNAGDTFADNKTDAKNSPSVRQALYELGAGLPPPREFNNRPNESPQTLAGSQEIGRWKNAIAREITNENRTKRSLRDFEVFLRNRGFSEETAVAPKSIAKYMAAASQVLRNGSGPAQQQTIAQTVGWLTQGRIPDGRKMVSFPPMTTRQASEFVDKYLDMQNRAAEMTNGRMYEIKGNVDGKYSRALKRSLDATMTRQLEKTTATMTTYYAVNEIFRIFTNQ